MRAVDISMEEPQKNNNVKIHLATTKYGTIIGNNGFEETEIEEYIKTFEKNVKKGTETIKKNNSKPYEYKINENYFLTLNPEFNYYPVLYEKLNELCEISSNNTHKQNIIDNLENQNNLDMDDNTEDLHIYLNELNKNQKINILKEIGYSLPALAFLYFGIASLVSLIIKSNLDYSAMMFSISFANAIATCCCIERFDENTKNIKKNKRKIRIVKRKLNQLEKENNINLSTSEKETLKLDKQFTIKHIPSRNEYYIYNEPKNISTNENNAKKKILVRYKK